MVNNNRNSFRAVLRRILLGMAAVPLFLILLIAAAPAWVPWIIRPAAGHMGLEFDECRRVGYSRLVIHGARLKEENFSLKIEKVEFFQPVVWLGKVITGRSGDSDFIKVHGWRFTALEPGEREDGGASGLSPYEYFRLGEDMLPPLMRWVPRFSFYEGKAAWEGGEIRVAGLRLRDGALEGEAHTKAGDRNIHFLLSADLTDPSDISLATALKPYDITLSSRLSREGEMLGVTGSLAMAHNEMSFFGNFAPGRMLPDRAGIKADALDLRGESLFLPYYDQAGGSIKGLWDGNSYEIAIEACAYPHKSDFSWPEIKVDIKAAGNLTQATFKKLRIDTPWLKGILHSPLTLGYDGSVLNDEPAEMSIAIDLNDQPFFDASGRLENSVKIKGGDDGGIGFAIETKGRYLRAFNVSCEHLAVFLTANLEGGFFNEGEEGFEWPALQADILISNIAGYGFEAEEFGAEAGFAPPILDVRNAEITLGDGTRLHGNLEYDIVKKNIRTGEITGTVMPGTLREHVPGWPVFELARITSMFSGSPHRPDHETELAVLGLATGPLITGDLGLVISGEAMAGNEWSLDWENEAGGVIAAGGTLEFRRSGGELGLEKIKFGDKKNTLLKLNHPAAVSGEFGIGSENSRRFIPAGWSIRMTPFMLDGPAGRIKVMETGIEACSGAFSLDIEGIGSGFFRKYITAELPEATMETLHFNSRWQGGGPLIFDLYMLITGRGYGKSEMRAEAEVTGREKGIRVEKLKVSEGKEKVFDAHGILPAALHPFERPDPLRIDATQEMSIHVAAGPHAPFWEYAGAAAGIKIGSPRLEADISGPINKPLCALTLVIDRLEYAAAPEMNFPSAENIELKLLIDSKAANLKRLTFTVEGQEIRTEAKLPLGRAFWESTISGGTLPDWRKLHARLIIEDADLEPVVNYFPDLLLSGGRLSADIVVEEGHFKYGEATLQGTSLRPLTKTTPIRDIQMRLGFKDRAVTVEELSAQFGGERITVEGMAEIRDDLTPRFSFSVEGENIPVVREPGLVIRGDLDLDVSGTGLETARVTGEVRLRDSMAATDWQSLVPRLSPASPERRPPFFSIDKHPLSKWELDVDIAGEEFLTVRAPGFRGVFSINISIFGTLYEPLSAGDIRIDSGMIRFPFASLEIDHGRVSITHEEPFTLQLSIAASSLIYGYDVELHVDGTACEPHLEFSSHPPLSSRSILLMLTAGELPGDEIIFTGQQKATKLAFYILQNFFTEFGGDGDIAQRLDIRAGEHVSEQGRETYHVGYLLLPGLSVFGEYDRFDALNFGVKWRFFVK